MFNPKNWGKIPILTNILQPVETANYRHDTIIDISIAQFPPWPWNQGWKMKTVESRIAFSRFIFEDAEQCALQGGPEQFDAKEDTQLK